MRKFTLLFLTTLLISSCSNSEAIYPDKARKGQNSAYQAPEKAFGDIKLFKAEEDKKENIGLGVNAYLWRATLNTISFMPILSADPFGGVILTDWKTMENDKNTRFKLNIYIMDKQLRADALQISIFKQTRNPVSNEWEDVSVANDMKIQIENSILTKAREIKISEINNEKK